jgi:hypothetical protein
MGEPAMSALPPIPHIRFDPEANAEGNRAWFVALDPCDDDPRAIYRDGERRLYFWTLEDAGNETGGTS